LLLAGAAFLTSPEQAMDLSDSLRVRKPLLSGFFLLGFPLTLFHLVVVKIVWFGPLPLRRLDTGAVRRLPFTDLDV